MIYQYNANTPQLAQAFLNNYRRPAPARDRSEGIKNIFGSINDTLDENKRKDLINSFGPSKTAEEMAARERYINTGDLSNMQNYLTRVDNAAYNQGQKEATEAESKIKEREIDSDNLRTVNSELINLNSEYQLAKDKFDTKADNTAGKEEARIEMETKKAALDDKMAFKKHLEGKLGYTAQEPLETTKPSKLETTINYSKPDKTISDINNNFPMTIDTNKSSIGSDNVNAFGSPLTSDKSNSDLLTNNLINVKPIEGTSSEDDNTSPSSEDKTQSPVLDKDSIALASFETIVNHKGTLTNDNILNIIDRLKSFKYLSEPSKTKDEANKRIADKNKLLRNLGIAEQDLNFINTKVVDPNAKLNTSIKNFKTEVKKYINNSSTVSTKLKGNHKDMAIREILDNVKEGNLTPEEKSKYINEILEGK